MKRLIFGPREETGKVYVMFRYDDYSSKSNTALEIELLSFFKKENIPITVGVIPLVADDYDDTENRKLMPLPPDKSDLLLKFKEADIAHVALHGYRHSRIKSSGLASEFSGRPYQEQKEMIAKGISMLRDMIGNNPPIFIPPWNKYDRNTLTALEKNDIGILSAAIGYSRPGDITYIPATCDLPDAADAVRYAKDAKRGIFLVQVLLHDWEFHESGGKKARIILADVQKFIDWCKSRDDVQVISTVEMYRQMKEMFSHSRMFYNNLALITLRKISYLLAGKEVKFVYLPLNIAKRLSALGILCMAFWFAALGAAGWTAGFFFAVFVRKITWEIIVPAALIFVLYGLYSLYRKGFGWRWATWFSMGLAFWAGYFWR